MLPQQTTQTLRTKRLPSASTQQNRKAKIKAIVFVAIVLALCAANAIFGWSARFDASGAAAALQQLMAQNLAAALGVYFLAVALGSTFFALPGILFAIVAGACFGPILGTAACVVSSTAGAILSFVAARYFLKESIKSRATANELLAKWLFGREENIIVTLAVTRLVPLFPFNLQNFAYGITDVSLGTYTLCTAIFIIPGTALYVTATAGVFDAQNRMLYLIAAACLLVVTLAIAAVLRRRYIDDEDACS